MSDKSILGPKTTVKKDSGASYDYINSLIPEVCLNGDDISKYERTLDKLYPEENLYNLCCNFVSLYNQIKDDDSKLGKLDDTKMSLLEYIGKDIHLSSEVMNQLKTMINSNVAAPSTSSTENKSKRMSSVIWAICGFVALVAIIALIYRGVNHNKKDYLEPELTYELEDNDVADPVQDSIEEPVVHIQEVPRNEPVQKPAETVKATPIERQTSNSNSTKATSKTVTYNSEAERKYRTDAEQGDAIAQYRLASCYESGTDVGKDIDEAMKWYRLAAENGLLLAINKVADYYYERGDYDNAKAWFVKAANQGDVEAQWAAGWMCEQKYNQSDNASIQLLTEAAEWYGKAAEKGHSVAQSSLADLYRYGEGVPKDIEKAKDLYRKASLQGHLGAKQALQEIEEQERANATINVKGVVLGPVGRRRDKTEPYVGVSVFIKGRENIPNAKYDAYTDPDGRFELTNIPKGTVLVFIYPYLERAEQVASEEMTVVLKRQLTQSDSEPEKKFKE